MAEKPETPKAEPAKIADLVTKSLSSTHRIVENYSTAIQSGKSTKR